MEVNPRPPRRLDPSRGQAKKSEPLVSEEDMKLFQDFVGFEKGGAVHSSPDVKSNVRRQRRVDNLRRTEDRAQTYLAGAGSFMGSMGAQSLKHADGRWNLQALAVHTLQDYGLNTGFPPDVMEQVAGIVKASKNPDGSTKLPEDAFKPWVRDLREFNFISVDNGKLWTEMDPQELAHDPEANVSSKDIDQLQTAIPLPNGDIKVMIAVSDLDAYVKEGTPLDRFIEENTSSIYTPDKVFNMVPEAIAEDLASLNPREERLATILEYTVTPDGTIKDEDVSQGIVKSRTKLDYASVGAWMKGEVGPSPAMQAQGDWLLDDLKVQQEASRRLEEASDDRGNVEFDTSENRIVTEEGNYAGYVTRKRTEATEMIENFMVTSNGVMSRFLRERGFSTIERAMDPPSRWRDIKEFAEEFNFELSRKPKPKSLNKFLAHVAEEYPEQSESVSNRVIRMSGRGEWRAVGAKEEPPGHFPMANKENTQCTASIRRAGDRWNTRFLKAALAGEPPSKSVDELQRKADNLNEKARMIKKAERTIYKQVMATQLEDRIGDLFDAEITHIGNNQTFCRIGNPPVEGVLNNTRRVREGEKIFVKLSSVNVEKGHIDFMQAL